VCRTKFANLVYFSWFCKRASDDDYSWICDGDIFWPDQDTLGAVVKVFATPISAVACEDESNNDRSNASPLCHQQCGRSVTLYLNRPIESAVPCPRALQVRRDFFFGSQGGDRSSLRLMTYNILANAYATSHHAMNEMYSYVPAPEVHLAEEYRGQLVVKELLASKAHLIALQECDKSIYDKYLLPIMRQAGYWGHFTNKEGPTVEGCALFVHRPSLRVLRCYDVSYRDVFKSDPRLQAFFELRHDVQDYLVDKIGSIGQILVVQSVTSPQHVLVAGNTHLFYHPQGCHVRLLQTDALLGAMLSIKEQLLQSSGTTGCGSCGSCGNDEEGFTLINGVACCECSHDKVALCEDTGSIGMVVMGDLNSGPSSVVIDLMQRWVPRRPELDRNYFVLFLFCYL
jgi:hypothetical protein